MKTFYNLEARLNLQFDLKHKVCKTLVAQNDLKTRAAVDSTPSQIPAFLPITFTLGSRSHKM